MTIKQSQYQQWLHHNMPMQISPNQALAAFETRKLCQYRKTTRCVTNTKDHTWKGLQKN